jgi:nucleotide-binding universal stress UspA family protein
VDVLYVSPDARQLHSKIRSILDDAKHLLEEEGITPLTLSESGSPADVIVQDAEDYDLAVIGAAGPTQSSDIGLGLVARRILERASGNVLIARPMGTDKGLRILAPLDGSPESELALQSISPILDLEAAEVTFLNVVETPWLQAGSAEETTDDDGVSEPAIMGAQFLREFRLRSSRLLREDRTRLSEQHPAVANVVREGDPAQEILCEAEQGNFDLIIVRASGVADLKHKLLGSVSGKIAWDAPCSVLVVKAT